MLALPQHPERLADRKLGQLAHLVGREALEEGEQDVLVVERQERQVQLAPQDLVVQPLVAVEVLMARDAYDHQVEAAELRPAELELSTQNLLSSSLE